MIAMGSPMKYGSAMKGTLMNNVGGNEALLPKKIVFLSKYTMLYQIQSYVMN